ncbi:hypothetical protein FA15DRAFT_711127 [Coprinopsis marcescibilis]|uniref:Uncharacterized protein n=1 Tax=Coprinopsis marcescibilis TaxID=230819 RepID=A0A5C3KB87_COPMA|nr:hypothetical protein FA15DRAFT_711127 [Coprinopsis marcescibilis]
MEISCCACRRKVCSTALRTFSCNSFRKTTLPPQSFKTSTKIFKGSACMTEDDKANVLRVVKDMMVSPTVLAYTTIDGKIMRVVNLMAEEKRRTQQAVVETPSISQTFDRLVGTFDLSLFTSPSAPPQPSNSNQPSRSRSPSSNRGRSRSPLTAPQHRANSQLTSSSRPPTPSSSFGAPSRPLAADPQYQFPASPIPASSLGPRRSIPQQHHSSAPSIDNRRHVSQQHQHSPAPSFNTHHPIPEQHHRSPAPTFDVRYPVPIPNRHTAPSHLNAHGPGQPPHQRAPPFETSAHQRPVPLSCCCNTLHRRQTDMPPLTIGGRKPLGTIKAGHLQTSKVDPRVQPNGFPKAARLSSTHRPTVAS